MYQEWGAPIKIGRLDVTKTLRFARADEDKIGRDKVILLQPDEVADVDALPGNIDKM